jgi:hypothetical protein
MTYESKRRAFGLFLSTELEAGQKGVMKRTGRNKTTYCLQRFSDSCILYLHTVHSSRSTTFFVVFAYFQIRGFSKSAISGHNKTSTHLLVEDRLSLTTISRLLPVVTALSLCEKRVLALLVLSHFMRSKQSKLWFRDQIAYSEYHTSVRVFFACFALAVYKMMIRF